LVDYVYAEITSNPVTPVFEHSSHSNSAVLSVGRVLVFQKLGNCYGTNLSLKGTTLIEALSSVHEITCKKYFIFPFYYQFGVSSKPIGKDFERI